MTKFLKNANLPTNDVSLCCIACENKKIKQSLNDLSIKVIECENNYNLEKTMQNHSDTNLHHIGENNVICNKDFIKTKNELFKYGFNVIQSLKIIKSPYPNDISLNCLAMRNHFFANIKYTDELIVKIYSQKKYNIQNVKQGYVKCSVCVVNENSIITSDNGLANIFKKLKFDVLLIETGDIDLNGYSYGFIGGCSGLIGKKKLAFTGDITKHKNWGIIKAFLLDRNVTYTCLTDERLVDIGSLLPLMEYEL